MAVLFQDLAKISAEKDEKELFKEVGHWFICEKSPIFNPKSSDDSIIEIDCESIESGELNEDECNCFETAQTQVTESDIDENDDDIEVIKVKGENSENGSQESSAALIFEDFEAKIIPQVNTVWKLQTFPVTPILREIKLHVRECRFSKSAILTH